MELDPTPLSDLQELLAALGAILGGGPVMLVLSLLLFLGVVVGPR